jgi:hypothetical protein
MTVIFGSVAMPSNLSEALNTSKPRKMMKEAVCATNFIKGLCRIFPSCNEREGKEEGEGETEGKREGEKEGEGE